MRIGACLLLAGCAFEGGGAPRDASIDSAIDAAPDAAIDAADSTTIRIEAEDYTAVTPSAAGHTWTQRTDKPMYSAACFLQLLPANGGACDVGEIATCAAGLTYAVAVAAPGMYYVHVRILSTRSDEDSLWVGLDGVADPGEIDQAEDGTWKWERRGPYALTAGAHAVNLWQREAGVRVDVLALSPSPTPPL